MGGTIAFRKGSEYMDFIRWKKECYILPSYELLPHIPAYEFIRHCWKDLHIPIGLVHPKAMKNTPEDPITPEMIRVLFDDPNDIACQPYVVVGLLMNVPIY